MSKKDDCIFCKIANHEIESDYLYEDDLVCAFRDLNPQAPVHVLVVPKDHYDNIVDDVPGEVLAADPKSGLIIACGEGAVRILELQAPGGKRMRAEDYLRGHNIEG